MTVDAVYRHDSSTRLATPEDVDRLIDQVLVMGWQHSVIALYDRDRPLMASGAVDHELRVAVESDTGLGGARYTGDDGTGPGVWYAAGQTADGDELLHYYMGSDEEWPLDSLVPIDLVRTAVKEFLASGGDRPTSPDWKPWA